jgi:hypothetical protein
MSTKLATFRIDEDIWAKFVEKARANNSTASELLKKFCNQYISGIDGADTDGIADTAIQKSIPVFNQADIGNQIEEIKVNLYSEFENCKDQITNNQNYFNEKIEEKINSQNLEISNLKKALSEITISMNRIEFKTMSVTQLKNLCKQKGINLSGLPVSLSKDLLIEKLLLN